MSINNCFVMALKKSDKIIPFDELEIVGEDEYGYYIIKDAIDPIVEPLPHPDKINDAHYKYLKEIWNNIFPDKEFDYDAFYLIDIDFLCDSKIFKDADIDIIVDTIIIYEKLNYNIYLYLS